MCEETRRGLRQTGERVVIYTDSREAIKILGRTPRTGTLAHGVKMASTELHKHYGVEVRVDWVPGHAGGIGDGAAQALASEHMDDRSALVTQTVPAPDDPDPTAKILAAKKERRRALWRHIPTNHHPLPRGLPRGAQVLIHKARAGAALTEDVLARWRAHHRCRPRATDDDSDDDDDQEQGPIVSCSTCTMEVCPTVNHLLWECPGYQDLRAQYLPPHITTLHQWTTPNNNSRDTLLSLWAFAHEAGIDRRM